VTRLLQMSALNAGRGRSHYLRTRGEAEALVKQCGLQWNLFQASVIFGPGDGLFTRFANLLDIAPLLPLARANSKFAPVYVGDVVEAICCCVDGSQSGRTFELYGPDVMTLSEIVRYTAQQRGVRRWVLPLPDVLGRMQGMVFDFVPGKPFSSDNYLSLLCDSVGGVDGLYKLGIDKTPVDAIVPAMLQQSRKQAHLDRYRAERSLSRS
jgi:NADH dehydrogenase